METMRTMLMQDIEQSWPADVIDVTRKNIEAEGIVSGESKFKPNLRNYFLAILLKCSVEI